VTPPPLDRDRSTRERHLDGVPGVDGEVLDERVTALVSALRGPAAADELRAEARVMTAFAAAGVGRDRPERHRRTTMRTVLAAKWGVAAVAVGSLTLGTAAAAYTGALPAPLQNAAHQVIGTPAVERVADLPTPGTEPGTPTAVPGSGADRSPGPELPGPAAFGLCTSWEAGELDPRSDAHAVLSEAAGGDAGIEAFCADVERPGPPAGVPSRGRGGEATPGAAPSVDVPPVDVPAGGRPTTPPAAAVPSDSGPPPVADEATGGGAAPGASPGPGTLPTTRPTP
jgi:hypothetical protein